MGLIGPGFIAAQHIEAVRRLGDVEVVALAGSSVDSARRRAAEWCVERAYGDYRELIAERPDRLHNGDALYNDLAGFLKSQNLPAPNNPPELLWNFEKFLIGRDGTVIGRFGSDITPDDPRLVSAIEQALNVA